MIMKLLEKIMDSIEEMEAKETERDENKYEKEAEEAVMFLQAMNM